MQAQFGGIGRRVFGFGEVRFHVDRITLVEALEAVKLALGGASIYAFA